MDSRATRSGAVAGLMYFANLFAVGFALETIRLLVLLPRLDGPLGETIAVLIELPIILTISWVVCRWLADRFIVVGGAAPRLLVGSLAFALLLSAEFLLGSVGFGWTPSDQLRRYRNLPDLLGLAGQLAFAAFPLLQLLRGPRTS